MLLLIKWLRTCHQSFQKLKAFRELTFFTSANGIYFISNLQKSHKLWDNLTANCLISHLSHNLWDKFRGGITGKLSLNAPIFMRLFFMFRKPFVIIGLEMYYWHK